MAVNIGSQINLNSATASIDIKYGPYASIDDAWDTLGPDGDDIAVIGLTVGIQTSVTSPIIEYWFKDACASKNDLVLKAQQPTIIDGGKAPTVAQVMGGEQ